jgi:hypothetical protein
MEFVRVEEAMTVVENLATTVARASTALDTALVLALTSSPPPSLAG